MKADEIMLSFGTNNLVSPTHRIQCLLLVFVMLLPEVWLMVL